MDINLLIQLKDVGDVSNWNPGDIVTCRLGLNLKGLAPSRLGEAFILNVRNVPDSIAFQRIQVFLESVHEDDRDEPPAHIGRTRYARRRASIDRAALNPSEERDAATVGTVQMTWGRFLAVTDLRQDASHLRGRRLQQRDF